MSPRDRRRRTRPLPRQNPFVGPAYYVQLHQSGVSADQALAQAVKRWGVPEDDLNARATVQRLTTTWDSWKEADRWTFLTVVEAIASAERAKHPFVNRAIAAKYRVLRRLGADAARLVDDLMRHFPPPWDVNHLVIAIMAKDLADFTCGCVLATGVPPKVQTHANAAAAIDTFRRFNAGRGYWELLAETVSMATGSPVSAGSIRRYRAKGSMKSPGHTEWNKIQELLGRIALLADKASSQRFYGPGLSMLGRHDW